MYEEKRDATLRMSFRLLVVFVTTARRHCFPRGGRPPWQARNRRAPIHLPWTPAKDFVGGVMSHLGYLQCLSSPQEDGGSGDARHDCTYLLTEGNSSVGEINELV